MCINRESIEQDSAVEIDSWERYEDSEVYPEGSKDKSLHIAPTKPLSKFIIPEHKYLLKLSYERYPEQFWVEIIAYKLGKLLGLEVPPAFVATNKKGEKAGALIEWFYDYPGTPKERKVSGTQYMQMLIADYDTQRGRQHNFELIATLQKVLRKKYKSFNLDWEKYWVEVLTFDALIGNTDRHQDNWGIIWVSQNNRTVPFRMTPIFDNGTSMGHEILEKKFDSFNDAVTIKKYVERGTHHMKWLFKDASRLNHLEFLKQFLIKFPDSKKTIIDLLNFDTAKLKYDIMQLTKINVSCKLSQSRANFIIKLLLYRQKKILAEIGV